MIKQDSENCLSEVHYEKIYKSSGGILVRRINGTLHYLAVLQKTHNGDLQWVSPKGGIEDNESLLEAAKREIEEEVGLKSIELIDFVSKECYCFTESDKLYKKTVFWYLFEVNKPDELMLNQEEGFVTSKWLTFEECLTIFTHKDFIEIIKLANNILYNNLEQKNKMT